MSVHFKVSELTKRFRSKADMYEYMLKECNLSRISNLSFTFVVNYYLPELKYCSWLFMLGILTDLKKASRGTK